MPYRAQILVALMLAVVASIILGIAHAATTEPTLPWGKESAGLQLEASTTQPVAEAATPVQVSIGVRNVSRNTVIVPLSRMFQFMDITVSSPSGNVAELTQYGKALKAMAPETGKATIKLLPGEERYMRVTLNRYFDMTLPGEYEVKVSRAASGNASVYAIPFKIKVVDVPTTQSRSD